MSNAPVPFMTCGDLMALASTPPPKGPCKVCDETMFSSWESMPGGFDRSRLRRVGTLRAADDDEPSFREHHPAGTHAWSSDAPIAPAFFPYNRCDVWQCAVCGRAFLRYTEFGGYYEDERIRALDPALLDDSPL